MEEITECRIPLLWNANGSIEVIRHDDVLPEEAKKFIQMFEEDDDDDEEECVKIPDYYGDDPLPKSCAPSPSPSVELNSEEEYQEKILALDDQSLPPFSKEIKHVNDFKANLEDKTIGRTEKINHNKNEKIFVCYICDKGFSRKFNLNTHIKCVHSDERDYVCPLCHRAFNHSSNLRKHIKTVHGSSEESKEFCNICRKPFRNSIALRNHYKTFHGTYF